MQAKKFCRYKCKIWSRPTNGESPSWRFGGTLAARRRNKELACYRMLHNFVFGWRHNEWGHDLRLETKAHIISEFNKTFINEDFRLGLLFSTTLHHFRITHSSVI